MKQGRGSKKISSKRREIHNFSVVGCTRRKRKYQQPSPVCESTENYTSLTFHLRMNQKANESLHMHPFLLAKLKIKQSLLSLLRKMNCFCFIVASWLRILADLTTWGVCCSSSEVATATLSLRQFSRSQLLTTCVFL